MNNLQNHESKRLLKELDFYESDLEYKSELVNHVETTFIQSVNEYLDENPTLKDAFDEKINKRIEESINKKISASKFIEQDVSIEDEEIDSKDENPKMRKLYREIVKQTHPDKIKNGKKIFTHPYSKLMGLGLPNGFVVINSNSDFMFG